MMDWEAAVAAAIQVAMSVRTKDNQKALGGELNCHEQQGLCWQCGEEGHFTRGLPYKGKAEATEGRKWK